MERSDTFMVFGIIALIVLWIISGLANVFIINDLLRNHNPLWKILIVLLGFFGFVLDFVVLLWMFIYDYIDEVKTYYRRKNEFKRQRRKENEENNNVRRRRV